MFSAMPAPRSRRVRCRDDVRACNVACAIVLSAVGYVAGCIGRDNVAGGAPGGGGAGASGATISCNATGSGCLCIADDAQPGTLAACSPVSVTTSEAERGVCCVAESLCTCTRYTCRSDPASSYCQCGSVAILATVTLGDQTAECPPPAAGQKCCFSPDNASCICSRLGCAAEETEVSACAAVTAGACATGEDIAACR
jgi:hypothetical protein